jgi:hypothetical protein
VRNLRCDLSLKKKGMSMITKGNYRAHGYLTHKTGLSIHASTEFHFSRFESTSISYLSSHLAYSGLNKVTSRRLNLNRYKLIMEEKSCL